MNNYKSQYLDPRWQKKRLQIMERDNFTCKVCNNNENTLNVHHLYYVPGKKVWDYPNSAFITACADCHGNNIVEFFNSQLEYIARLIIYAGLDNDDCGKFYSTILLSCMGNFQDYIKIDDTFITIQDQSFTAYDIIETIVYNRLNKEDIGFYCEACFMTDKLLEYNTEYKEIDSEINLILSGIQNAKQN